MKYYKVFRAGKYPQGDVTKEDVKNMAESYDPQYFEAPLTVDHQWSGPALGWVDSVLAKGNELFVAFKDLSEEAVSLVKSGKYKRPSIEIMRDEEKGTYLRAVSLVVFPAVRSLPAFEFHEKTFQAEAFTSEDLELEFTDITNQQKNTMDIKTYAEKLGLGADVSAEDVLKKFSEKVDELTAVIGTKDSDIEGLNARVADLEADMKKYSEERVTDLVAGAVKAGKILKNQEANIKAWAESNFDACKNFIDSLEVKAVFDKNAVRSKAIESGKEITYQMLLDDPELAKEFSDEEKEALRKKDPRFLN